MVRGSEVKKRPLEWLWKPYLPRGKLSAITGDPGVGKTTLLCSLIADLTRGRALPGQEPLPPINCWLLSSEDDASDTLAWLLENHDADMDRVYITDDVVPDYQ